MPLFVSSHHLYASQRKSSVSMSWWQDYFLGLFPRYYLQVFSLGLFSRFSHLQVSFDVILCSHAYFIFSRRNPTGSISCWFIYFLGLSTRSFWQVFFIGLFPRSLFSFAGLFWHDFVLSHQLYAPQRKASSPSSRWFISSLGFFPRSFLQFSPIGLLSRSLFSFTGLFWHDLVLSRLLNAPPRKFSGPISCQ